MATGAIPFTELSDDRKEIVADALHEAFESDFSRRGVSKESAKSFLEQNFRAHNLLITVWEDGALVATAGYVRADKFYISNVYVAPESRGKGLARTAVTAAEDALVENHGARHAHLWCDRELSGMYEKLGYALKTANFQIGREKFVDVMEKRLAPESAT